MTELNYVVLGQFLYFPESQFFHLQTNSDNLILMVSNYDSRTDEWKEFKFSSR